MKITPPRSTERIASEFLPDLAEMEWISKFRLRTEDLLLRNIARSCFTGIRPTDDEAQCALNVLCRPVSERDWKAEVLAVWILGFAKPSFISHTEAQEKIKLALPSGFSYRRTIDNLSKSLSIAYLCMIIIGVILGVVQAVLWNGMLDVIVLIAGAFVGGMIGGFAGSIFAPLLFPIVAVARKCQEKQIQKAALYTLRRWDDPRFIGEVARASIKTDAVTMAQVQETFARLLSKLTPEYYGVMPAGTTESLCRALEVAEERTTVLYWKPDNSTVSIPYVKNLLRALELVGSGQAAKYVRAVIEQNWNEEITRLAMSVLTILSEREQEETARTTLLRHSAVPVTPDELLRPAANTQTHEDAETLMRPIA